MKNLRRVAREELEKEINLIEFNQNRRKEPIGFYLEDEYEMNPKMVATPYLNKALFTYEDKWGLREFNGKFYWNGKDGQWAIPKEELIEKLWDTIKIRYQMDEKTLQHIVSDCLDRLAQAEKQGLDYSDKLFLSRATGMVVISTDWDEEKYKWNNPGSKMTNIPLRRIKAMLPEGQDLVEAVVEYVKSKCGSLIKTQEVFAPQKPRNKSR